VRMFKVLSDPTRLSIVRSLFQQPHCTQQLAHVHQISEAAVSKHLKLLTEASFVTTERRGNYVFYALQSDEVEMLIVYLRQFLEQ
jgi:DNA-binding transcriptional ArsR family regulator